MRRHRSIIVVIKPGAKKQNMPDTLQVTINSKPDGEFLPVCELNMGELHLQKITVKEFVKRAEEKLNEAKAHLTATRFIV
jgi:hypothetical protein